MDTGSDTARADALAALLAGAAPSAGALEKLDPDALSDGGLVDGFTAAEKLVRCAEAWRARYLGALHARGRGDPFGSLEAEAACAAHWASSTAQNRLHQAASLAGRFPETLRALQAGEVSWEQAKALADLTAGLDDALARRVQDKVLPRMPTQTVVETRRTLRYHIHKLDPEAAKARHRHQRTERRVAMWPEDDGMATVSACLPADTAQAIMDTLTKHAKKRVKGDKRTLDQRRADTLARILLTGAPSPGTGAPAVATMTHVVVPLSTLMGRCEEPGQLGRYGPIGAEQARMLAFAKQSKWRLLIVDDKGTLLGATANTYRPPAAIRKIIELRRPTCSFPGCNMPAERCDLDHRKSWAEGGCTGQCNIDPLCRRHHNLKTHANWTRVLEDDGDTLTWTTPTNHAHTSTPTCTPPACPTTTITDVISKESKNPDTGSGDPAPVPPPNPPEPTLNPANARHGRYPNTPYRPSAPLATPHRSAPASRRRYWARGRLFVAAQFTRPPTAPPADGATGHARRPVRRCAVHPITAHPPVDGATGRGRRSACRRALDTTTHQPPTGDETGHTTFVIRGETARLFYLTPPHILTALYRLSTFPRVVKYVY